MCIVSSLSLRCNMVRTPRSQVCCQENYVRRFHMLSNFRVTVL